jgi:hypothetical protein
MNIENLKEEKEDWDNEKKSLNEKLLIKNSENENLTQKVNEFRIKIIRA